MRLKNSKGGFTLAELLIVIAIVAVLVAIGIPVFMNHLENARKSVCEANRRSAKIIMASAIISGDSIASNITNGMDWETLWPQLEGSGYQIDEEICPSGGVIKVVRKGDSAYLTCSIHKKGWMTNQDKAADLLDEITKDFTSPDYNAGEEKRFMEEYLKKANENGGLYEVPVTEALSKFPDSENGKFYRTDKNDSLVWVGTRVFFDGKAQDIVVATTKGQAQSSDKLKGFIFYYNGNYYRSSKAAWDGSYDYAMLTQGYKDKDETLEDFLNKNNWELAN